MIISPVVISIVQILCKRLLVFSLKVFNHTNVSVSTTQGPEIRELPRDYLEPGALLDDV